MLGEQRDILVVDDKELMRDSVGATLQRAGLSVVTASDGAAALDMIAKRRPDAVPAGMRIATRFLSSVVTLIFEPNVACAMLMGTVAIRSSPSRL